MNSSTVAPPSRFANSAETGTRVPRNNHAPLTLCGCRSTALQVVQSSTGLSLHLNYDARSAPKSSMSARGRSTEVSSESRLKHVTELAPARPRREIRCPLSVATGAATRPNGRLRCPTPAPCPDRSTHEPDDSAAARSSRGHRNHRDTSLEIPSREPPRTRPK